MRTKKCVLAAFILAAAQLSFVSSAQAATYVFTSHTFTNCSTTGQNGPTQTSCRTAYSTTWDENNSYFTVTGGIQSWTSPANGTYTIRAIGAGGAGAAGGNGASMTGTFTLTNGQVLKLLVGQTGVTIASGSDYRFGGGGGSYVATSSNVALIVAGGGGGSAAVTPGLTSANGGDGSSNPSPANSNGGAAGTGSSGCGGQGQGGAGFNNNGTGVPASQAFTNGGTGGTGGADQCPGSIGGTPYGGFGGGGAGGNGGGGGGGYYGGNGGDNTAPVTSYPPGTGGGSYNSGTSQTNTAASNRNTAGSITITLVAETLPDTTPPTFPSADTFNSPENQTSVATIIASESATITIYGGEDQAKFSISKLTDSSTALSFVTAPDFEAPTDVGSNNTYIISFKAVDGAANIGYETITVTVTDVLDTTGFSTFSLSSAASYRTATTITIVVTAPSKVTFKVNGLFIPGCKNRPTTGATPNAQATCSWKPSTRGSAIISATAVPTGAGITGATSSLNIAIANRTGKR